MDKFLKNDFEKQQTQVPMQVESKDAMIIKINPWRSKISYPLYGTWINVSLCIEDLKLSAYILFSSDTDTLS